MVFNNSISNNEFFIQTPSTLKNPKEQYAKYLELRQEISNRIEKPFLLEWQYLSEMLKLRRIFASRGSTLFSDMLFIYNTIRKLNLKRGIEIGAWYGYGLYYMSKALNINKGELISIDIKPLKAKLRSLLYLIKNTTILKGKSVEVLPIFENDGVEFVFIDGEHTYDTVSKELQIISNYKKLKVIFMHDMYQHSPSYRAWEDNCEKFGLSKKDIFIMDDSYYFFDQGSKWIRKTGAVFIKN